MPRLSDYEKWENDGVLQDKLILVQGWARDGLTEPQIANNLGIAIRTLCDYKLKYPQFLQAIKKGKEVVDFEVENALFKNAINGNVTAQIFWLKNRKKDNWKDKVEVTNVGNEVNNQISNIANLINNPKPNRGEDDVQ